MSESKATRPVGNASAATAVVSWRWEAIGSETAIHTGTANAQGLINLQIHNEGSAGTQVVPALFHFTHNGAPLPRRIAFSSVSV